MNGRRWRWLAVGLGLVTLWLDRWSKGAVERYFEAWQAVHPGRPPSVPVLGEALRLTYVHNRGIVFGLFSRAAVPHREWWLLLGSSLVFALAVVYFLRVPASRRALMVGLGLVLGGAIGNLVDRVRLGYVVDFIDVSLYFTRWYVFNVADAAVVIGVALMAIDAWRTEDA